MIAIIKYNAGNIGSVQNAVSRLGYSSLITDDATTIGNASKVIFPGVGQAGSAMKFLKKRDLDKTILSLNQPVLGICLGLQLMCRHSQEGDTDCLEIFDAKVKRFPSTEIVPHVGWNNFLTLEGSLLNSVEKQDDTYYLHSYYAELCDQTMATCHYGVTFSAVMQKDNFYATQFHPEKSGKIGDKILQNFLKL